MAAGLQVWDGAGNLITDSTTWMGQMLGSFTLEKNHAAGSIYDANLTLGRPFAMTFPEDGNYGAQSWGNPDSTVVTISGATISWPAGRYACRVVYGVY